MTMSLLRAYRRSNDNKDPKRIIFYVCPSLGGNLPR